jgi:hypothetical protein
VIKLRLAPSAVGITLRAACKSKHIIAAQKPYGIINTVCNK